MISARALLVAVLALACVAAPLAGLDGGGAVAPDACTSADGCCCAKAVETRPADCGQPRACGGDQLVAGCRCGDHPAPASHHDHSEPRLCSAARAALGELLPASEPGLPAVARPAGLRAAPEPPPPRAVS
jgi:hypothetical protein